MRPFKDETETYDWCLSEGNVLVLKDVEWNKVKAHIQISEEDYLSAQDTVLKRRWNSAYKLHYDVLHQLAEAYLLSEERKSRNHQCLFAYLCVQHPELELSWDFFEKIRTRRNGLNYYGTPITEKDWKEVALQFNLYIKVLREALRKKVDKA